MNTETRGIGQALLDHHRAMTYRHNPGRVMRRERYLIVRGNLCDRGGVPAELLGFGDFYGVPRGRLAAKLKKLLVVTRDTVENGDD